MFDLNIKVRKTDSFNKDYRDFDFTLLRFQLMFTPRNHNVANRDSHFKPIIKHQTRNLYNKNVIQHYKIVIRIIRYDNL